MPPSVKRDQTAFPRRIVATTSATSTIDVGDNQSRVAGSTGAQRTWVILSFVGLMRMASIANVAISASIILPKGFHHYALLLFLLHRPISLPDHLRRRRAVPRARLPAECVRSVAFSQADREAKHRRRSGRASGAPLRLDPNPPACCDSHRQGRGKRILVHPVPARRDRSRTRHCSF